MEVGWEGELTNSLFSLNYNNNTYLLDFVKYHVKLLDMTVRNATHRHCRNGVRVSGMYCRCLKICHARKSAVIIFILSLHCLSATVISSTLHIEEGQ